MEDNELVKSYREGDESALTELIKRHIDSLFAFTYRLSGDRAIADDAVQNTFVKAWKNIKKFDETKSFKAWIFSIARNAAIDLLRQKKNIAFSALDNDNNDISFSETLSDSGDLSDVKFDQILNEKMLEKVLAELSPNSRTVVLLHDVENLTFDEIGQVLKEPLNTIKSRYRRAILSLKEAVLRDKRSN